MHKHAKHKRRGSVLIYATFGTFALAGISALAVDWGRVQLVRTELQAAADAAARYAASGLQNDIAGVSSANANAAAVVAQNKADGRAIAFNANTDCEIGVWNSSTRAFTPSKNLNIANAVRVTLRCDESRNTAVPMTFLSMFGRPHTNVSATSIAIVDFSAAAGGAGMGRYEYYIPATSNPWLSGMPAGSVANPENPAKNPDYAGANMIDDGVSKLWNIGNAVMDMTFNGRGNSDSQNTDISESNWSQWGDYASKKGSPIQAGSINVNPGSTISFDGVNGGANNSSSKVKYDGDGNTGWIVGNLKGAENGIANVNAPINSVIGVFLTDDRPNKGKAPTGLDFSTNAARNYTHLSPELKQPFFIGNGRNDAGEIQKIIIPEGATRLYIGTMDGYEWNNNVGGFMVTAHTTGRIITVK
jgi:Flp pilus assembly protein TadG